MTAPFVERRQPACACQDCLDATLPLWPDDGEFLVAPLEPVRAAVEVDVAPEVGL